MKYTLIGSLGNITKPLAEILIGQGHEITVISSNEHKKEAIEALGAKAAIGSITDVDFLTKTFSGADAIYTMVPPNFGVSDYRAYMAGIGKNYTQAIQDAVVKRVVNLSSIGAHLERGTGPISGLYDVEHLFNSLESVSVKHLRAGFFYVNFLHDIPMIRNMNIMGNNFDQEVNLVMVHPKDIAAAAAKELQQDFTGKSFEYIVSDEAKIKDVVTTIGQLVGKPSLPWVQFSDEEAYNGMTQAGLPPVIAKTYVEMGTAVRSRQLFEDYVKNKDVKFGSTKLADFAKEFLKAYNNN